MKISEFGGNDLVMQKIKFLLIFIYFILFNTYSFAYYKTIDDYKTFKDIDLIDKDFNMYSALFCAIASEYVYDTDFKETTSRMNIFLQKNKFEQVKMVDFSYLLNDVQATTAIKTVNNKTIVFIVFRGTNFGLSYEALKDVITDAAVLTPTPLKNDSQAKIHAGFAFSEALYIQQLKEKFPDFYKFIFENKNKDNLLFLISGHSLGGAIATVLTADLIDSFNISPDNIITYTYGAPAVGNSNFKFIFEDNPSKEKTFKYFYRIRHLDDPVPYMAPSYYKHLGEQYIIEDTSIYKSENQENQDILNITDLSLDYHNIKDSYIYQIQNYTLDFSLFNKRFENYNNIETIVDQKVISGITKEKNVHIVHNQIYNHDYFFYDDGFNVYSYPSNHIKRYNWLKEYDSVIQERQKSYYNTWLDFTEDAQVRDIKCYVDQEPLCLKDFKFLIPYINENIIYDLKQRHGINTILPFLSDTYYTNSLDIFGLSLIGKIDMDRLYAFIYFYIRQNNLHLPNEFLNTPSNYNFFKEFGGDNLTYYGASKLLTYLIFYKKIKNFYQNGIIITLKMPEDDNFDYYQQYLKNKSMSFTKIRLLDSTKEMEGLETLLFFQRLYKLVAE